MDSKKYYYYLAWKDREIPLFKSQFLFLYEDQCLRHYEKGIAGGIFDFNRAGTDQVWSELGLWGLIGRAFPVELVRILCAFGCRLKSFDPVDNTATLRKSYWPVTYYFLVKPIKIEHMRNIFYRPLEADSDNQIPLLFEMSDRLLLGNYYITRDQDADVQMPQFCKLLEIDLCIAAGEIQGVLSKLFFENCKLVGECASKCLTLAENDSIRNVIRGCGFENSLIYIGELPKAG